MNLHRIMQYGSLNQKASHAEINQVGNVMGVISPELQLFWEKSNGLYLNTGLKLYSTGEILERNETFEVKKYAPGYLMIGDDSGGLGILISTTTTKSPVYVVDQGVLDPDYMKQVGNSLTKWIEDGCPLGV